MTTSRIRVHAGARRVSSGDSGDLKGIGTNRINSPNPWSALWAMMVGLFVIQVDSTIVAVANPTIMTHLDTGYDTVTWVTSAYLLAYVVPLLVAGRLGDRFGPKNLYLIGLTVFTAASLWCGLSSGIGMLITARVVQGVGAGLLTPQTLSMITRIFPPLRRGAARGVWGATIGVATLIGPLLGGVLVDRLDWAWIFLVNVPVGVVGLILALRLLPALPTYPCRFDLFAVGLSALSIFLIVFALQQGPSVDWAPWSWAMLVAGVGSMAVFVYWQSVYAREPLIPIETFRDRNFTLSNIGVAITMFATTAMVLPAMFYLQEVCGLSPTRAALLSAPMTIVVGVLAPIVGQFVDRSHPRRLVGFGFSALTLALTWFSIEMSPATPIWRILLPCIALGVAMAFLWSPLATAATRNLPAHLAGAGSGVYNATGQLGAVLGSAGMAAFMTSRVAAEMPPMPADTPQQRLQGLRMPEFLREPFAVAMSQSMLLPACITLFGLVAALFMVDFATPVAHREADAINPDGVDDDDQGLEPAACREVSTPCSCDPGVWSDVVTTSQRPQPE